MFSGHWMNTWIILSFVSEDSPKASGLLFIGNFLHLQIKIDKEMGIYIHNFPDDIVHHGILVGMNRFVPGLNHIHPAGAVLDDLILEGFPGRISGTHNPGISLVLKIVFHDIPSQFVSKFKGFYKALPFYVG